MIYNVSFHATAIERVTTSAEMPSAVLWGDGNKESVWIQGDREERIRVLRLWAEAEGVQTDDGGEP